MSNEMMMVTMDTAMPNFKLTSRGNIFFVIDDAGEQIHYQRASVPPR